MTTEVNKGFHIELPGVRAISARSTSVRDHLIWIAEVEANVAGDLDRMPSRQFAVEYDALMALAISVTDEPRRSSIGLLALLYEREKRSRPVPPLITSDNDDGDLPF